MTSKSKKRKGGRLPVPEQEKKELFPLYLRKMDIATLTRERIWEICYQRIEEELNVVNQAVKSNSL